MDPARMVLLRLLLNQLLWLLSHLVPKRPGTILLGAGLGRRFCGNPKYLYLHLLHQARRDPTLRFRWITSNPDLCRQFAERGWPVVAKRTPAGFWAILRAETLVIESGTAPGVSGHDIGYERLLMGRFRIVQTWHGTPLKKIALDTFPLRGSLSARLRHRLQKAEFRRYALLPVQSEYDIPIYQRAFANPNVLLLGNARNDVLVHPHLAQRSLKEELGLPPQTRCITYAPTFRDHPQAQPPFSPEDWISFHTWLEQHNTCLLIKKHPFDRQLAPPTHLSRIRDVSSLADDIQELLLITDLLITDYSSVSIDFAITRRPILFFTHDLTDYQRSRDLYVDLHEVLPGPFATSMAGLLDALEHLDRWWNSPDYQLRYRQFCERFLPQTDGRAGERLLHWILNPSHTP